MRNTLAAGIMALSVALPVTGVAQTPSQPATKGQTPEAAAEFIDTVLGGGVTKVGWLTRSTYYEGLSTVDSVSTANCLTVIIQASDSPTRAFLEIDWRTYLGSNSFYDASVSDRWAARLLAKTTRSPMTGTSTEKKQHIGLVVEPGAEEMKDRLIRAFEFYGKSCTPLKDSPF